MNPDQFFEKFELLSDTPNAVGKMRELILHLAVRGKLVVQDPDDKPTIQQKDDNKQAEHPRNWVLGTLYELAILKSGVSFPSESESETGQYLYVKISDMNLQANQFEITTSSRHVTPDKNELRNLIPGRSIIFPKRGGAIATNKKRLVKEPLFIDSNTMAIICPEFIELRYLHIWFLGIDLWRLNNGTSVPQINNKDIGPLIVPVPPLAEQKRIVAKVDELMALCDRLEAQQKERETQKAALVQAYLTRFTDAPTPTNLEFLFHKSYAVEPVELRQSILTLAVQGKLVSQDQGDEGVAEVFASIPNEDILYSIPENWKWTRLGYIYCSSFYGPRFGKDEYVADGIPTIRTTDMTTNGKIVLRDPPLVRIDDKKKFAQYSLKKNDLLVTRSGTIGMMAVFDGDYDAIPSAYLIRLRFPHFVLAEFYYLYLKSRYGQELLGLSLRSTGVPNVNAASISKFPAPVPPLLEQKRIVAKVDELMALLDKLEAQLAASREAGSKLLEAVMAEIAAAA